MANAELEAIFSRITAAKLEDEDRVLDALASEHPVAEQARRRISAAAEELVSDIRRTAKVNALDALLGEYGLGSEEGVALLRLAEALMRIPDAATMDALIADKLVPVDWRRHRGKSNSRFVNAATLALELTAYCLQGSQGRGIGAAARRFLRHASTPAVRFAVRRATRRLAGRFVLGSTIDQALRKSVAAEKTGFSYSYDMLGEAALTQEDADFFFDAYKTAIRALKPSCTEADFRDNRGVSIKLSALHPRYEMTQRERVLRELTERTLALALMAKDANMGLNIDAEEADRLELSLEVIEAVLRDPGLAGWDGFGIVVQAYGKAAPRVLDWLLCAGRRAGPENHDPAGQRSLLGHRDQARPSRRFEDISGLHKKVRHRRLVPVLRAETAGDDRPDLSSVRGPQRAHGFSHSRSCRGPQGFRISAHPRNG